MRRFHTSFSGPAVVAALVAAAGVISFQTAGHAPAVDSARSASAPATFTAPAPEGDVPFIGRMDVTATRS